MKHKKSELTRARIIAAAKPLFTEKGFDETSVAEICRESGVSNGALFHQFKVKEDIAFAVFCEVRAEFWDRVISAMVVCEDPLDGVEAAVEPPHTQAGAKTLLGMGAASEHRNDQPQHRTLPPQQPPQRPPQLARAAR